MKSMSAEKVERFIKWMDETSERLFKAKLETTSDNYSIAVKGERSGIDQAHYQFLEILNDEDQQ